ncbi:glutathione S-transferase-like [Macrosteles quadrilineatus]|uniref:glutathione S-transferase-like n=1 Tax=Macrosteles quadrilineatus TaxID=74068 RepID=UPI0023E2F49D|nr:glutathione S-transferase-like [Macrosteles quadrilineatus]
MAPKYKLSYFNVKALGEPIRMMLSYMGEEFEDHRFESDEWVKIKPTTPFGKSPVLYVDGNQLCQSRSITRYLGRKAGLAGKDEWEDLQIDMIVDVIDDFRAELAKYEYEKDAQRKAAVKGPLFSEIAPFYLKKIDAVIKNNNGFLANGKLSWADVYFLGISDYLSHMYESDIAADYPNIKALLVNVSSLPKIKAWIDKRPATDL